MAVSSITVTYKSGGGRSVTPEDWYEQDIYDDATITTIDETGEGIGSSWFLFTSDANSVIASGEVPAGRTMTLSEIFPGQTLAGNRISDGTVAAWPWIILRITPVGPPSGLTLSSALSRGAVELSWQAGSAGTNNSVAGYDIGYRDSEDGVTWPGSWQTADGSPTTALKLSVSPPETAGHYRQFRVCTRGSAGSSYDSDYVAASSLLRRKWDAFGAWEDETLTAEQSHIRAVYITQIRERIDVIRAFYGMEAYAYTPLTAGVTGIAQWAALIKELRFAVDEIGAAQSWNTLEEGKPRIAHIMQLRQIIDEM